MTSKVRGKDVKVTTDSIAAYLNYTRPQAENIEYPREDYTSLTGLMYLMEEINSNLGSSKAPTS